MPTKGDRVARVALGEVGVTESPNGSNWGLSVSKYIRASGINYPIPWCGAFLMWVYEAAGVSDSGIANPGTATMCDRARAQGAFLRRGPVPAGAFLIRCGTHVDMAVQTTSSPYIPAVGGNVSNGVNRSTRVRWLVSVIVPPDILESDGPEYRNEKYYYIESVVFGPWKTRRSRRRVVSKIPKGMKKYVRPFRKRMKNGKLGWAFSYRWGAFKTMEARDTAYKKLSKRYPGLKLRKTSVTRRVKIS